MPRPRKSPEQKQSHTVKLSLTGAMHRSLSVKAQAADLPLATYCTQALAGARSPHSIPPVNRELYNRFITDLGLPLSNLAQILQILDMAQRNGATIPSRLLMALEGELEAIKQLRLGLITENGTEDRAVG